MCSSSLDSSLGASNVSFSALLNILRRCSLALTSSRVLSNDHHRSDYSFALHDAFPNQYTQSKHPTPLSIVAALLQPYSPAAKIKLQQYQFVQRILQAKSKSFSFAAVAFEGRLQLALPCLYAVCRVADDAVDLCACGPLRTRTVSRR